MNRLRPDVEAYVQKYLATFRAPPKKVTHFGPAGRITVRGNGERVLYAPDGTPLRVIENPEGGTHVEQGDSVHVVIRPGTVSRTGGS